MYLICVAQQVDDPLALYSKPLQHGTRRLVQQLSPCPQPISSTKSITRGVDFAMRLTADWLIASCDFRWYPLSVNAPMKQIHVLHMVLRMVLIENCWETFFSCFKIWADTMLSRQVGIHICVTMRPAWVLLGWFQWVYK